MLVSSKRRSQTKAHELPIR